MKIKLVMMFQSYVIFVTTISLKPKTLIMNHIFVMNVVVCYKEQKI